MLACLPSASEGTAHLPATSAEVILWSCDDESFGMTAELDIYRAANILVKESSVKNSVIEQFRLKAAQWRWR
jgi:hypothetical protein